MSPDIRLESACSADAKMQNAIASIGDETTKFTTAMQVQVYMFHLLEEEDLLWVQAKVGMLTEVIFGWLVC